MFQYSGDGWRRDVELHCTSAVNRNTYGYIFRSKCTYDPFPFSVLQVSF